MARTLRASIALLSVLALTVPAMAQTSTGTSTSTQTGTSTSTDATSTDKSSDKSTDKMPQTTDTPSTMDKPAVAPGSSSTDRSSSMQARGEQIGSSKQLEGKIQSVESGKLTLTDGTILTIPGGLIVQQSDLKPGASVKASYEERGDEKVVTSMQVDTK
jgi:hypothetical protein